MVGQLRSLGRTRNPQAPASGHCQPAIRDRFATVSGLRLHYRDWGGDGPPLLALHGASAHTHITLDAPDPLADCVLAWLRVSPHGRTPGQHPVVLILHGLGSRRAGLEQWLAHSIWANRLVWVPLRRRLERASSFPRGRAGHLRGTGGRRRPGAWGRPGASQAPPLGDLREGRDNLLKSTVTVMSFFQKTSHSPRCAVDPPSLPL